MSINEDAHVEKWLYGRLNGDNGAGGLRAAAGALVTGIYPERIPQQGVLPAVRYSLMDAHDLMVVNGIRIWSDSLWLVAAVVDGASYGPARAAADRIDTLLHRAAGNVAPVAVLASVRERTFRLAEDEGATSWRHLGGVYRIKAQEA